MLAERALIEFADGDIHFVNSDIGITVCHYRVGIAEFAAHAIHVVQLFHRSPAFVTLPPIGARRQPYSEGFSKVLVGMLLRVPAFHVPHEQARKRNRFVVIAIRSPKRSEMGAPFFSFIERVGVIEGVASLMAHVHHDLPGVFNVVHLRFETLQFRIGKVERDSDDRFHVWAAPLIGEVALGTEFVESFSVKLFVELLDEAFEGRAFQLQAELLNWLGEDLLDLCRRFFKVGHGWSKRSTGMRLSTERWSPIGIGGRRMEERATRTAGGLFRSGFNRVGLAARRFSR